MIKYHCDKYINLTEKNVSSQNKISNCFNKSQINEDFNCKKLMEKRTTEILCKAGPGCNKKNIKNIAEV